MGMRVNRFVGASVCAATLALGCSTQQALETIESAGEVVLRRDPAQLRESMRTLWTDHVVWTRNYIVSALANDPATSVVAARLLRNQEDIGNAVKPYYGSDAGNRLTALLKDHITIAVDVVAAAKAGDAARLAGADRRWHANAADIATFLAEANPNWTRDALLAMLNEHLRLTTEETKARLEKRWADDVRIYDQVFAQAMQMADALTDGIVKQFPNRF